MVKLTFITSALVLLAACQGPEPTARNPNGTLALAGSGNYVYNRATGSYSRFSSELNCSALPSTAHPSPFDKGPFPYVGYAQPGCFAGEGGGTVGSGDGGPSK